MVYKFLYFILLIILLIETSKSYSKTLEYFASSPTNNRLSNYEEDNSTDKFAYDNEEILLVTQLPNVPKKIEFSYIRAPLNKWIIIYVKSNKTGSFKQISNFAPIQIKYTNYKTLNLLGFNNFFISDNSATFLYYIKFLDKASYQNEINMLNKNNKAKAKYINCLNVNIALSKNQAIEKCKTLLS